MLRKKIVAVSWLVILLLPTTFMAGMAMAVTDEEIQESIDLELEWLADQQNPDGSWGVNPGEMTAVMAFALIKMQDRAYELGYGSPFDPEYEYSENVELGWDFIFATSDEGPLHAKAQTIGAQIHDGTPDDPDLNGNGVGIYFDNPSPFYSIYTTGICLMALEASRTPGRLNDAGEDFDGDGSTDTFQEIAQDAAEWMAFAQGDSGNDEGG